MRVVVSVKPTPGEGGASQAARYIAYSDRYDAREGKEPRPLFSAKENSLSFWKAERVLTEGRTRLFAGAMKAAELVRDSGMKAVKLEQMSRIVTTLSRDMARRVEQATTLRF